MAAQRAHPHRTVHTQDETQVSAEYVRASHNVSTAWVLEHTGQTEPCHTRDGGMQARSALPMSEIWYPGGRAFCASTLLICTPARQSDQQGPTVFFRPTYHRVNQCEWIPGRGLTMFIFPRSRDVIPEDSPSRELSLVLHSVPPWGVSHSSDVKGWLHCQQH
jgi:hypothetical protein